VNDLNFLGLNINNTLSWKAHIDKLLSKLSSACFAMQAVKPFVSTDVESNLLLIFPLYNLIRCHFLGSHSAQYKSFKITKENNKNYDGE